MKVLVVAAKTAFVTELGVYLTLEGNRVTLVSSGEAAATLASASTFDAVLLRFEGTTLDMVETIRLVQTVCTDAPFLILDAGQGTGSSASAGIDTMSGSSVTNAKILSRLRWIRRRNQGYREQTLQIGLLQLNRGTQEVRVSGTEVDFAEREFQLLELLMVFNGAVLTKEVMLTHLYGGVDEPAPKIVDVLICKLRRKLARVGAEVVIKTVYGCGYMISGRQRTDICQITLSSSRLLST